MPEPREPYRVRPPFAANYHALTQTIDPADDSVTIVVVRQGGATLAGDAGARPVQAGDVIVMTAADTPLRTEPEPRSTATTLHVDCAYLSDQAFWQHSDMFSDRLDAMHMLEARASGSRGARPTRSPDRPKAG